MSASMPATPSCPPGSLPRLFVDAALEDESLPMTGHVLVNLQLERASVSYASDAEALRGRLVFRAYTEPTT